MVAIGSYGQPSALELQAKTIRANCGDVPILVSDDHSEDYFRPEQGPEYGQRIKQRILDVCEREGMIYRDTAPERIGHAGGDLGSFYHGLIHARNNDIEYVCKLSQRFIIDIPGWLEKTCRTMRKYHGKYGTHTATHPCSYGGRHHFHMRTECVFMHVPTWTQPHILVHLTPRVLHGRAAEWIVNDQRSKLGGVQLGPTFYGEDRQVEYAGVAWKDVLPINRRNEPYYQMAAKYGVELGEEFNTEHSFGCGGFKWG